MSSIQEILASILNAVYGKDVRQAIHDGVEMAYNKADNAETSAAAAADAASGSQESAAASAQAAANSASSASDFADAAEQYKNEAFHTTPAGYEAFVSNTNSNLDYLYNSGVKNFYPIVAPEGHFGVNCILNDDGTITTSGTSTGANVSALAQVGFPTNIQVKISGAPSGANGNRKLQLADVTDNYSIAAVDQGSGATVTLTANHVYQMRIYYASGTNMDNLTWKPMMTLASCPNSDYAHYVPYSKTNREITDEMKANEMPVTFDENVEDYLRTDRVALALQINAVAKSGICFLYLNMDFKAVNGTFTDVTLATVSGLTSYRDVFQNIAAQDGSGNELIIRVDKTTGDIVIAAVTGTSATFYRAMIALPMK